MSSFRSDGQRSRDDRGGPAERGEPGTAIRIAAAGDIHCRAAHPAEVRDAFAQISPVADVVLLAGDLTAHGEPAEAEVLAAACRDLELPVFAVLGNHDWHLGKQERIAELLTEAGVVVLQGEATVCELHGHEVGIVGAKGFVGGFGAAHLPDFGEPSLRQVYAETSREVRALDEGLRQVSTCPFRIVLLHYSPTEETLQGERPGIWPFLGTDRLAAPILEHQPDLVLHGHAHAGALEARIGEVPVYNVSVPVIGRDFWVLELSAPARPPTPIH